MIKYIPTSFKEDESISEDDLIRVLNDPINNEEERIRRELLFDGAVNGDLEARRVLKEEYNLTMIFHNGMEVKL